VIQLGYSFDNEEDEIGVRCIGAPVFDADKKAVAAISVAGTSNQISNDRVLGVALMVNNAAKKISSRLGYVA
jgi:DNA-binding IclR family transcriptional regulator